LLESFATKAEGELADVVVIIGYCSQMYCIRRDMEGKNKIADIRRVSWTPKTHYCILSCFYKICRVLQ